MQHRRASGEGHLGDAKHAATHAMSHTREQTHTHLDKHNQVKESNTR